YQPNLDCGDYVIIVNADKIRVTGRKLTDKVYIHHTGWPGGYREASLKEWLNDHPERVVEFAVKGMLPKNRLGRQLFSKLKVYSGPTHEHAAQKPKPLPLLTNLGSNRTARLAALAKELPVVQRSGRAEAANTPKENANG
ncbi:MAG: 50S ribosomal protein L13, partial [Candidatus Sericytochromatia bacterium]|nr:50S ribosomal protein L13 [Candidatus Tanganyikabacteria bacterium]